MTDTGKGYIIFIAALGMMLTLISADVSKLQEWGHVWTPSFVAQAFAHLGAVITAFIGGRLIPTKDF
jgi:hypothetical protein